MSTRLAVSCGIVLSLFLSGVVAPAAEIHPLSSAYPSTPGLRAAVDAPIGNLAVPTTRILAELPGDARSLEEIRAGEGGLEGWAARFEPAFDGGAEIATAPDSASAGSAPSFSATSNDLAHPTVNQRHSIQRDVPRGAGTVVFLTDFGLKDPAVAICKLVMARINDALRVIDLTHLIPPFNVRLASNFLSAALRHALPGTVFVAVVDPGVGSARKSIAVLTGKGHVLVGPDNGLFAQAVADEGLVRAVELRNPAYHYKSDVSSTFHGRDIYAPVGAHLASGVALEDLGPALTGIAPLAAAEGDPRLENGAIHGEVVYVEDPFGSVLTNIPRSLVEQADWRPGRGVILEIEIGGRRLSLPYERTFSDVPVHAPLALIHSREVLSFSINRGSFAHEFGVGERIPVVVRALVDRR